MRLRLVPKSMILDDLKRPKRTLVEKKIVLQRHQINLNEDSPILSSAKM